MISGPRIAVISWRNQEADFSPEFRFAEKHFRRSLSAYPMVLSEIATGAGIDHIRSSHPWLADVPKWFIIRSPMALLSESILEVLNHVFDDHPDLVSVAAAEIGKDQPENAPQYPYFTWRGFVAFQEAMVSRPPVVKPLIGRDPFAFMLDHSRIPSDLGGVPIGDLPRALATEQTAIATHAFVHPLDGYYRYPRMDVVDLLPEKISSLLDVGCGSGAFGRVVREKWGCRVVGVELNSAAAASARLVLDEVIEGDINDINIEDRFDVITVNDVLEHVEDPEGLLKNLRGLVTPDGQLVVSIPNVGHWSIVEDLLAGHWDYLPAGLLCIDHLRFFTRRSVTSMMERAGWQPLDSHPIPGPLPEQKREMFHRLLGHGSQIDLESLESQGYIIVAKRAADSATGS
ncbi:MAG: class I SAM-dependent methyltransferase [Thermoanaerobaculales bacterium]|nr:class I SAM-dependent methyltransferase [Thermoanaerobaculales bacterium]